MEKLKEFFKKILDNSKVIIIALLCVIFIQACSRCSHNTKDQWKESQYTEQIALQDIVIESQKIAIDSLNIEVIVLKDSLKLCQSGYQQAMDREKALKEDKDLMKDIIRKQNRAK